MKDDGVDMGLIVARVIVCGFMLLAVGIVGTIAYYVVPLVPEIARILAALVLAIVGQLALELGLPLLIVGIPFLLLILVGAILLWAMLRVAQGPGVKS